MKCGMDDEEDIARFIYCILSSWRDKGVVKNISTILT